jgi:hypothetical protein
MGLAALKCYCAQRRMGALGAASTRANGVTRQEPTLSGRDALSRFGKCKVAWTHSRTVGAPRCCPLDVQVTLPEWGS